MHGVCSLQVPHSDCAKVQLFTWVLLVMWGACHSFPNMRYCVTLGLWPCHAVLGTFPVPKCRVWFYLNAASLIACSQWWLVSLQWWRDALAAFIIVLLTLSAIPFSWGVWGTLVLWGTSCVLYIAFVVCQRYSFALSVCSMRGLWYCPILR